MIGADLLTQTARSAVEEDDDLADRVDAHHARRVRIEDLVDGLDLEEVIAGAERSELRTTAVTRGARHPRRIRAGRGAVLLGELEILVPPAADLHGPTRTLDERPLELGLALARRRRSEAGRHVAEELIGEPIEVRPHVV